MQLSFQDVVDFCGTKSFDKGKKVADFEKLFVQGNVIFGLYFGSVGSYKINIIFKESKIAYAWCTCPAMSQYDDNCKHIAGLLINWVENKNEFMKLNTWDNVLESKSKQELIAFIKTIAGKSIDVTNILYGELFDESLIDQEELYDPEEW